MSSLYKQRKFFDSVAKKLNFTSLDEWYKIDRSVLSRFGFSSFLKGSYSDRNAHVVALVTVYSEHTWKLWKFKSGVPYRFWLDSFNRRSFFDWLGTELGCVSFESWYAVSLTEIETHGGSALLNHYYKDSVYAAVTSIYPEYPWVPWRFDNVTRKFWSSQHRRRSFFDWLGRELGYGTFESWYSISSSDIESYGASTALINYYDGSVYHAMADVYPEHPWIPWRFHNVPRNFWSDVLRQRSFFDWLAADLGHVSFECWSRMSIVDFRRQGGYGIISQHHDGSVYKAMTRIYPEYPWIPWRFNKIPLRFHESVFENVVVKDLSDWYRIPLSRVKPFGITTKSSLIQTLKQQYPWFDWSVSRFQNSRRKIVQWKLRRLLEEILKNKFREILVLEDYGLNPYARENATLGLNKAVELDLFVPSLNLAFEYQGLQHYRDHFFFGPSADSKLKDERKRRICKRIGITLIVVAYDLYLDEISVMDLVRRYRPDVID